MRANLVKGDYRYEALQTLWNFFKEFGEPEDNENYWHSAVEWCTDHYHDDLTMNLLLTALNCLQKEVIDDRK